MLNVSRLSALTGLTAMVLCGALACSKHDTAKPAPTPENPSPEVQKDQVQQPQVLDPAKVGVKLESVISEHVTKDEADAVKVDVSRRYTITTQQKNVDQGRQDGTADVSTSVLFPNKADERGIQASAENTFGEASYYLTDECLDSTCGEVIALVKLTKGDSFTDSAIRFKREIGKVYVVACALQLTNSEFESKDDALKAMESACQPSSPSTDETAAAAQD